MNKLEYRVEKDVWKLHSFVPPLMGQATQTKQVFNRKICWQFHLLEGTVLHWIREALTGVKP